jgi:hypothetical protein
MRDLPVKGTMMDPLVVLDVSLKSWAGSVAAAAGGAPKERGLRVEESGDASSSA